MIIALCGKSGSGKSTFAREITQEVKNSIYCDIDKIGHQALKQDSVKENLIKDFGTRILTDNEVDRKKLSKIVFDSPIEMEKLNNRTWEYMESYLNNFLMENKNKLIILDWQLLPKTKFFCLSNIRILIDCPYEVRKQRAMSRDNITEEAFDLREKASITYDKNSFDYIITDENKEKIKRKVFKL